MTPADAAFYEWWDAPKDASTLQDRYLECWRAAVAQERERGKRVKAWAVVNRHGLPFECDDGSLAIFDTKEFAMNEYDAIGGVSPERVVPVEIVIGEEK